MGEVRLSDRTSRLPDLGRRSAALLLAAASTFVLGCSNKSDTAANQRGSGSLALLAVESGALVDVYGLRRTANGGFTSALVERDVLIGADISDERDGATRDRRDEEILYDFLSPNPDNLQPRLLITREIGSAAFLAAFDALDDRVRRVTPGRFGQDTTTAPFSVVARNAGLRLTFSGDLGIDSSFFYTLQDGQITGVKNPEAVQLLRIVGDPNDSSPTGDFEVLPARIVARGNQLLIDPVLLGSEGVRLQVRNQAGGLPEAADQIGGNIRLAIATEGPLAIPRIRRDDEAGFTGLNNSNLQSLIRDFRSGNINDDTAEISRGFRRDPVPPRIVGEMLMYLERVEEVDPYTQLLTIYKHGIAQRIDAGDALRITTTAGDRVIAATEIVANPGDRPLEQHVRVLVRREDALAAADPARLPGYPSVREDRERWLLINAPRAVLVAEFESGDGTNGDDPQYFLRFSPSPIPDASGQVVPNRNVSPFAAAIVRFSKPVDLTTVRAQDTLFFATTPLLGSDAQTRINDFIAARNMDPASFELNKYITPHLVVGERYDEDGSQTTLRLQPPYGFYLDDAMRVEANLAFRTYYLHVLGGRTGIKDLSGNELDFLAAAGRLVDNMVVPFTIDVRRDNQDRPLFPNNRVVNVARRFAALDEDEQPSYFMANEIRTVGGTTNSLAYPLDDLFGAVNYIDGRIHARPTGRISRVADDLNQTPPPPQTSDLRWCPEAGDGGQVPATTAGARFGQPIQNPLNPYGCRLVTIWREIDLSLSRVDPNDFNLDVEEVHWAPHSTSTITFDEFDRMSLFLGHSEFRAENCVSGTWALPDVTGNSGLNTAFDSNYARNYTLRGVSEQPGTPHRPAPHVGYREEYVVIDAAMAFTEPNNVNRYMPLPPLQKPYFVWRDETSLVQGARAGVGSDVSNSTRNFEPYIISPWLMGGGRFVTSNSQGLQFNYGRWFTANNYGVSSANRSRQENITDGLTGAIALPLLGDFQMYPDLASLPEGRGYVASGANGWQISLTVQSSIIPNFRVFSGGGVANGRPRYVQPGTNQWSQASGGVNPINGQATPGADNSFYWAQWDFLRRQSVVTSGFVDILNPHRIDPALSNDPRLGPYYPAGASDVLPVNVKPVYSTLFEPPLSTLPGGSEVVAQYRGASIVDPNPWVAVAATPLQFWTQRGQVRPDHINFPLDPRKAGDAHIRKFQDATPVGAPRTRNFWVYPYNQNVTDYVDDPNRLTDGAFLANYAAASDSFRPNDVRYFNWRFIMKNNVDANPPVSPSLESFAVIYRLEQSQ